jgi:tetratricopeptide (TPR) repeat protein
VLHNCVHGVLTIYNNTVYAIIVSGFSRKGAALQQLKRYSDAAAAYTQALSLDPNNTEYKKVCNCKNI